MTPQPLVLKVLNVISMVLFLAALAMVFLYAPLEASMGQVQRVFYFHISTAWVGMLGFLVAAAAGTIYLVTRNLNWDIVELAAVEISLVFFFIAIASGSIWARPIWNTWWMWDARLTTAAILEIVYAAYLLLRQGIEEPERRAHFCAVYALIGSISVPITFMSIRLSERVIHPVMIGLVSAEGTGGNFLMAPTMLHTMLFCIIAFSVFFTALLWHRIRLELLVYKVERLRIKLLQKR